MGKSARVLGAEFDLTAQEMNFILKEEGYLEGEPGNYILTEKGKQFGTEQDNHRGTGGYDWYNRYWTTRTWDDSIKDELNITEERKKELRQTIKIAKQQIKEARNNDIKLDYDNNGDEKTEMTNNNTKYLVAAVIVLLVAVSSYGVYKAYPYIKKWWKDKAVPKLKKHRKKITIGLIIASILALFFPFLFRKK